MDTVRITSKGQVTIPEEIRNRLGLLPHTEVTLEVEGDAVRIRRTNDHRPGGKMLIHHLRGRATGVLTSDEIMHLTRDD